VHDFLGASQATPALSGKWSISVVGARASRKDPNRPDQRVAFLNDESSHRHQQRPLTMQSTTAVQSPFQEVTRVARPKPQLHIKAPVEWHGPSIGQSTFLPFPPAASSPTSVTSQHTNTATQTMLHTVNPYAQGGWSSPSQNNVSAYWQPSTTGSTVYGVFPAAPAVPSPDIVSVYFSSLTGDALNSVVNDSTHQTYLRISTTQTGPIRVTSFSTVGDTPYATVEWASPPLVTIKNRVPRQDATKWMLFSRDRQYASFPVLNRGSDI